MNYKQWIPGFVAICLIYPCLKNLPVVATPKEMLMVQATTQNATQLTEEGIRQAIEAMRAARDKKDVSGVLQYIAPFAHSEITVELPDGILTLNVDGQEEHRKLLEETFAKIKERKTTHEQVDIRLSADGQMGIAVITQEREFATHDGKQFFAENSDILRFGLVDNRPAVVSATLKGWLAERPPESSK